MVVHCKREPYDVYIGRGSKWGNPFSHKHGTKATCIVPTRDDAIQSYDSYLKTSPELIAAIGELKGKILGCWCHPKACHGHLLAHYAENPHELVL
jgi:hypothetical protein